MASELPPDSMILQALHAIRDGVQQTNARLEQTNARLEQTNARLEQTNERIGGLETALTAKIDQTNQRLDSLREFTVKGLTDLNQKVDEGFDRVGVALDRHSAEIRQLNLRIENVLTGEGAKLVKRVDALEDEVRRIGSKIQH